MSMKGAEMKQLTMNPFKNPVIMTIKGFDFIDDCEMPVQDFKQLCFKNNWEGTLHKVAQAEAAILPTFSAAIDKYLEIRKDRSS